jgi:hypothetical protein
MLEKETNYRRQRSRVETFGLQYMLRVRVSRIEAETFALSKPRPLLQLCCNQLKLTGRHATIRFFLLAEIRSFICSNGATM